MKIIFAGTPEFSIPSLEKLLNSHHEICAVITQPDRPKGRGQKLQAPPIKTFALEHNLPVLQPATLKDENILSHLKALNADVFVDVACGLFLPKNLLTLPKFGCINVHPSLLPRFRGAAPIQRAILVGDVATGVTIMQMNEGLDTGDIIKQSECFIKSKDTALTLGNKLATLGAELLLQVLDELEVGPVKTAPQDNSKSNYAAKIEKEEAKIDWQLSVKQIDRMIRAFNPWPVAFTEINGTTIRIFEAEPIINENIPKQYQPGTIIEITKDTVCIAAKDGFLKLLKIQLPGGKVLSTREVLNSNKNPFTMNLSS